MPAIDHRALVVTKESNLGEQSVAVLKTQLYECESIKADADTARDAVRSALAAHSFDLVIAQQRMSPYSASEVLRDVNATSGRTRPAVVCLAYDGSDRNTFIREGGAGFVVLEPGQVNLDSALSEGLRQVQQHRDFQRDQKNRVLMAIDRFGREDEFQLFVLDIFRELKYFGVRRTHGVIEKGRDLVCWELNRMARHEFVGVQIKLGDVHASSGGNSVTELWRQAIEAFHSPVPFPSGQQYLDKFVVIVSGRMNEIARTKLSDFVTSSHLQRRIHFFDREELADLIVTSCPEISAGIH